MKPKIREEPKKRAKKKAAKPKRKMRKGGGKAKGSGFEREFCKLLSSWVTNGSRNDVFWRSAISGGRATTASKKGQNMAHVAGDICAVHPAGFNLASWLFFELKYYKDLQLERFVLEHRGKLWNFWLQACTQASKHGKYPVLVFKQNTLQPAVLMMERHAITFGAPIPLARVSLRKNQNRTGLTIASSRNEYVHVLSLADLLKQDPEDCWYNSQPASDKGGRNPKAQLDNFGSALHVKPGRRVSVAPVAKTRKHPNNGAVRRKASINSR